MVYGYARVSTTKQMKNGNSLEDQERALREAGAEVIYSDAYTGTKMDRPQFSKLMEELKPGDKFVVTKLDRFARTAVEGGAIVQQLHKMGITIHILNMGVADNTPMGKLMVTMLLAFAEFERDMIVERTQTGRAIARENGIRVDGRPRKFTDTQLTDALKAIDSGMTYKQAEKEYKISKSTLIRAMREGLIKRAEGV